jgi:hypothetical protein
VYVCPNGKRLRLNAFTLRGRKKVRVQWMMYAMVHNIEKIAHHGDLEGPPGKTVRQRRRAGRR